MIDELIAGVEKAGKDGKLLESTVGNILYWIRSGMLPVWAIGAIDELIETEAHDELNDRFFRYLAFGTGGMRGRTIGAVTTEAETGTLSSLGSPEHAGVGTPGLGRNPQPGVGRAARRVCVRPRSAP